MIVTAPHGHIAEARAELNQQGRYRITSGTVEFGSGTSTVHTQIAAAALGCEPHHINLQQADTDTIGYDAGSYGSSGTTIAAMAVSKAAEQLRAAIVSIAATIMAVPTSACVLAAGVVSAGARELDLAEIAQLGGAELTATCRHESTSRSVSFNVQAFRVAVQPTTGVVRILQSVHAADAGTLINPQQCLGQVEGGVAQAIGSTLYEELLLKNGVVTTADLRNYHILQSVDVPQTDVYFADTYDTVGPTGAKSMSESPYNPVAAALANAIRDATGVRMYELPMNPPRGWHTLAAHPTTPCQSSARLPPGPQVSRAPSRPSPPGPQRTTHSPRQPTR